MQNKSAIDIAKDITRGDRQRDYAHPLLNMVRIAVRQSLTHRNELKEGMAINPYKATLAMVDVKFARQEATGKQDNLVDAIGYTDMIDRMANKLVEFGYATSYASALEFFDGWSAVSLYNFWLELEKKFESESQKDLMQNTTDTVHVSSI